MTRVITVISGKGGVGKTTVVSNLGACLRQMGKSVIVVDGNVTCANLGVHLGMSAVNPVTLNDVLKRDAFVTQAMYQYKDGFSVIPASIGEIEADFGGLRHQIGELLGHTDIVLIDAAAGVGAETDAAIDSCDEVMIVTNPEYTAVLGAMSAKKLTEKKNKPIMGIVVNKRMGEKHEMSNKEIEIFMDSSVIATVRSHRKVREAIACRVPVVVHAPRSSAARNIMGLAYAVSGEEMPMPGVLERVRNMFDTDVLLSFE